MIIGMARQLHDGMIEYDDGTPASTPQMAYDVNSPNIGFQLHQLHAEKSGFQEAGQELQTVDDFHRIRDPVPVQVPEDQVLLQKPTVGEVGDVLGQGRRVLQPLQEGGHQQQGGPVQRVLLDLNYR